MISSTPSPRNWKKPIREPTHMDSDGRGRPFSTKLGYKQPGDESKSETIDKVMEMARLQIGIPMMMMLLML